MQARLSLLVIAAWLTWPGGSAAAQVPRRVAPATRGPKAMSYVSLVKSRGGDRALVISYPWKVHRRASVEIRLVTGKDPGPSGVRPLLFVKEHMKGEGAVAVFRCQDNASGAGMREPLTEKEIKLEIVGRRNSLGRQSVYVLHELAATDPVPGTAAVYCLLPAWAINKRLLYLDLPRDDFAQPGKMHVWFLRQDKVLWSETVDWPGYEKRSKDRRAEPPAGGSPAAPAVVD